MLPPLVGFRKNRRIRHLLTLRYPTLELDQEDAVAVSDAQFGPNEFGICPDAGAHCWIDVLVRPLRRFL
jgi:hypothetical protein